MRVCKIKDCERKHEGHGYCATHLSRLKKGLDLSTPIIVRVQHGKSRSREYGSWQTMVQRCTNPNNTNYFKYGARGITICDSWRDSFEAFYNDMGKRPEGTTLDRIDNDGNYEPNNCRWATITEQNWNKRPKKNSTGYPGIYAIGSKWAAKFRTQYLGSYSTKLQAHRAYLKAKEGYIAKIDKSKLINMLEEI